MPTEHVYRIVVRTPESGPEIDFELPENSAINWLSGYAVVEGKAPLSQYVPIRFTVYHPEAEHWDFYSCAGTLGIISSRAADVLRPYTTRCFNLLECRINKATFFFLGVKDTLDCLDQEASDIVWFDDERKEIMRIKVFAFKKDIIPDPILFMIPQSRGSLLCKDTIAELIHKNGFKGFNLFDAEDPKNSKHW